MKNAASFVQEIIRTAGSKVLQMRRNANFKKLFRVVGFWELHSLESELELTGKTKIKESADCRISEEKKTFNACN
jgi:hypothetical protein